MKEVVFVHGKQDSQTTTVQTLLSYSQVDSSAFRITHSFLLPRWARLPRGVSSKKGTKIY